MMGGSGGGGGGAGVVDYPAYMKDFHGDLLNQTGADTVTISLVDAMNAAFGSSPFAGVTAYDPDADIATIMASVNDLDTLVTLLSTGTGLDALIANILDDTRIDDAVDEFSLDLGDRLTSEVLPRFEGGMRDINAVVSSAFVLGRANIEASQTRQVAKYSADLHMKAFGDDAIKVIGLKLDYQRLLTHMTVEANRIKIVAKKEEAETNMQLDESDASWDLEVFQHGGNLLAGIGGGVIPSNKKKKNAAASAIGGAMTGAAAGAMVGAEIGSVGSGYGALIGAVIGAAAGLLME
jgi:hypothetical protein